jgi:hypothetical protein
MHHDYESNAGQQWVTHDYRGTRPRDVVHGQEMTANVALSPLSPRSLSALSLRAFSLSLSLSLFSLPRQSCPSWMKPMHNSSQFRITSEITGSVLFRRSSHHPPPLVLSSTRQFHDVLDCWDLDGSQLADFPRCLWIVCNYVGSKGRRLVLKTNHFETPPKINYSVPLQRQYSVAPPISAMPLKRHEYYGPSRAISYIAASVCLCSNGHKWTHVYDRP